jgi:hypothetical protein
MILGCFTNWAFSSVSSSDFTNERLDAAGGGGGACYDDGLLVTAGATGNLVATNGGSGTFTAVMIALKEYVAPVRNIGFANLARTIQVGNGMSRNEGAT